ncbi:MAG TPA: methyl-accepting chemotaxis protein, partial [Candidatus Aminicenantes bacterium]|nr:methyl-accepting chemotaxis protein [Candidatus Aminicenantes bacterium]
MNKSLKFKITIPVIGIVFLLLVVMVLTSLFISGRQIGRIAEEKGKAICVIQSEGLLALLTFEDKDGIKTSLKSLTKDPAIVHAQVLNPKGEVLGEVGEKLAQAKGENPREDLLVKKIDIGKRTCQLFRYRIRDTDKKEIGTLVLAMSLETLSAANRAITLSLLIIGLIALVVVGLVLMVLVNRVIKPLIDTSRLMEELASGEGDLTRRLDVQTTDEIGKLSESFNNFVEKIRQIIVKVKESADAVFTSTGEITSSSEDLATRTNEQAASITETSTTLEQFTSIVRQNSQNSEEVSTALKTFNEEIQTKKSLMDNVTSTMKEIDDS